MKHPVFKTKTQLAYEYLREAIFSAQLSPGERVQPSQVADELGISEMPVREALRTLESEGLVEITPHVGAQVTAMKPGEMDELFLVRTILESFAARTVAQSCPPETLQRLEELVAQMEEAAAGEDYVTYGRLNTEFHRTIYSAAPIERLRRMLFDLWESNERSRSVFKMVPSRLKSSLAEHRAILEALRARDGRRVEELMRYHKAQSFAGLLEEVAQQTGDAEGRVARLRAVWRDVILEYEK